MDASQFEHRKISAGGVGFHCVIADGRQDRRAGHTVLFLHPFPLNAKHWRYQLPKLADAGYRAVAIDLRGFGQSDMQPGPVTLDRLAMDAASVLRALGAPSASVVGAGMGGAIATALALDAPAELRSAVLVGAAAISSPPKPGLDDVRGEADEAGFDSGAQSDPPELRRVLRWLGRRGAIRRHLMDGSLVRGCLWNFSAPDSRQRMMEMSETYSSPFRRRAVAEAASQTYEATQRLSLKEKRAFKECIDAQGTDIPVLSVHGELDVPGAGHYLAEEQPSAMTKILLEHLESIEGI